MHFPMVVSALTLWNFNTTLVSTRVGAIAQWPFLLFAVTRHARRHTIPGLLALVQPSHSRRDRPLGSPQMVSIFLPFILLRTNLIAQFVLLFKFASFHHRQRA